MLCSSSSSNCWCFFTHTRGMECSSTAPSFAIYRFNQRIFNVDPIVSIKIVFFHHRSTLEHPMSTFPPQTSIEFYLYFNRYVQQYCEWKKISRPTEEISDHIILFNRQFEFDRSDSYRPLKPTLCVCFLDSESYHFIGGIRFDMISWVRVCVPVRKHVWGDWVLVLQTQQT